MASAQTKRQKLAASTTEITTATTTITTAEYKETSLVLSGPDDNTTTSSNSNNNNNNNNSSHKSKTNSSDGGIGGNSFGVGDVDDLSDDTDSDEDDDDDELDDDNNLNGTNKLLGCDHQVAGSHHNHHHHHHHQNHADIQEQLAAAGPAGVAAAAAIATARKRKRPHCFETNPSVRKRQQTRLIRKLRACIDEYTMRVGQQAIVLITMPGKAVHNFKVFGAQPLESVIRTCKHEIMAELEQTLSEQAPQQFKEDTNKHELPPLVIDGIPTPVEKMTQAQLRAFIPLMLKYSTGRGKPGWGKDTTRPPWWPETLPWANVRSDARDENEKQRISWTTTLRQIVTNCYKYHGRDDLLPTFDENEESLKLQQQQQQQQQEHQEQLMLANGNNTGVGGGGRSELRQRGEHRIQLRSGSQKQEQQQQQQQQCSSSSSGGGGNNTSGADSGGSAQVVYSTAPAYATNFVHTITNSDGTVSLIQVDPANAQILTLPDGTQVRAVRLQTLGAESLCGGQPLGELQEASSVEISALTGGGGDQRQQHQHHQHQHHLQNHQNQNQHQQQQQQQTMSVSEASLGADGQIIITGEDGTQSCYPMSSLVSIPASVYQQFAQGDGQQLSIMTADGTTIPANAVSIHAVQEQQELTDHQQQDQQVTLVEQTSGDQQPDSKARITEQFCAVKTDEQQQQQQQQ